MIFQGTSASGTQAVRTPSLTPAQHAIIRRHYDAGMTSTAMSEKIEEAAREAGTSYQRVYVSQSVFIKAKNFRTQFRLKKIQIGNQIHVFIYFLFSESDRQHHGKDQRQKEPEEGQAQGVQKGCDRLQPVCVRIQEGQEPQC